MSETVPKKPRRTHFARTLERLRLERGITQYRLSQLSGLGASAINKLEAGLVGSQSLTFESVWRVAMALDRPITDFVDPDWELPEVVEAKPRGRPATKKTEGEP